MFILCLNAFHKATTIFIYFHFFATIFAFIFRGQQMVNYVGLRRSVLSGGLERTISMAFRGLRFWRALFGWAKGVVCGVAGCVVGKPPFQWLSGFTGWDFGCANCPTFGRKCDKILFG